jgi:hypothetical protein
VLPRSGEPLSHANDPPPVESQVDHDPGDHRQTAPDVDIVPTVPTQQEYRLSKVETAAARKATSIIASTTKLSLALLNMQTSNPHSDFILPTNCVLPVSDQ